MADEQKILTDEVEETLVSGEAILPTENTEATDSTETNRIVPTEAEPTVATVETVDNIETELIENQALAEEAAPVETFTEAEAIIISEPVVESTDSETTVTEIETQSEPAVEKVELVETTESPVEAEVVVPTEEAIQPETPAEEVVQPEATTEEITDSKKPEAGYEKAKIKSNTIGAIVIALVIVLGLVYYMTKDTKVEEPNLSDVGGKITVSDKIEQGKVTIIEEVKNPINIASGGVSKASDVNSNMAKMPVTVFIGNTRKNPNSADCAQVYPVNRQADKRYESSMINTVLSLLEPLTTTEKENGYISVIPAGTFLQYIKIDDSGIATANFSGTISKAAGSCAVTAIKSQIRNTLIQFASVKSVVICINGNCNQAEILQP